MDKKNKVMTKQQYNDKLTNWYMVNLTWGVIGILGLMAVRQGYRFGTSIAYMQPLVWTLTGIFAFLAIGLFVIGKVNNIKRGINYGWLMVACTGVSLWLALYNKLRPAMEQIIKAVVGNETFILTSFWNIRIPMFLISAYLVISFVWVAIKIIKR